MYTQLDHEKLRLAVDLMNWASEIVNEVMEQHRLDVNMQMISFLSEAKHDADLGIAAVTEGDAAQAPSFLKAAGRAAGMADRYMGYQEQGKTA